MVRCSVEFVLRRAVLAVAFPSCEQLGGPPMGLTLKLDILAVMAAFAFLGAIVFGAF